MKSILKNKILIIFSIFLLLIFLCTTFTFASFNLTYNGTIYGFPDLPFDTSEYEYVIFCTSNYSYVASLANGYGVYFLDDVGDTIAFNGSVVGCCKIYRLVDNDWSLYVTAPYNYGGLTGRSFSLTDGGCILFSSIDIYSWTSGELVFQKASQTVGQVTIPTIAQAEEIPQAMTEVMKILLPIGLIVLSIGLVIYLMRLVTLRMK